MTDLEQRLEHISERCAVIQSDRKDADPAVVELAYLLGYLASILEKHLRTNER